MDYIMMERLRELVNVTLRELLAMLVTDSSSLDCLSPFLDYKLEVTHLLDEPPTGRASAFVSLLTLLAKECKLDLGHVLPAQFQPLEHHEAADSKHIGVLPETAAGMDGVLILKPPLSSKSPPLLFSISCAFFAAGVPSNKVELQRLKAMLEYQFHRVPSAESADSPASDSEGDTPMLQRYAEGHAYDLRHRAVASLVEQLPQLHLLVELPNRAGEPPAQLACDAADGKTLGPGDHAYVIVDDRNLGRFLPDERAKQLLSEVKELQLSSSPEAKDSVCPDCSRNTAHKTCRFSLCPDCCARQTLATCALRTHQKARLASKAAKRAAKAS